MERKKDVNDFSTKRDDMCVCVWELDLLSFDIATTAPIFDILAHLAQTFIDLPDHANDRLWQLWIVTVGRLL